MNATTNLADWRMACWLAASEAVGSPGLILQTASITVLMVNRPQVIFLRTSQHSWSFEGTWRSRALVTGEVTLI